MKKIQVMVNGLPGKMATMVVEALAQDNKYLLVPFSFTGPEISQDNVVVHELRKIIDLITPDKRLSRLDEIKRNWPGVIIIDFTLPDATNENCAFYCENGLPFVMGTTGGDRNLLTETVKDSAISAVISPNMSIPIVALMAMIDRGTDFPNALNGFELMIIESHQSPKVDKSGTAKAIGGKLQVLGADYKGEEDILAVRDPKQQRFMGVPEEALGGHGWHSYALMSPDRSVFLKIEHNINGRQTYVEGTLKAIDFLAKQIDEGVRGKCFSMIDVIQG